MFVLCTDLGTPNGGNPIYINPAKINVIGITTVEQTLQGGVVLPAGSGIVWMDSTRNFAVSASDVEKLVHEVTVMDTKVVYTQPIEAVFRP